MICPVKSIFINLCCVIVCLGAACTTTQNIRKAEDEIAAIAEEFGSRLKLVSLLAPSDVLEESMREAYSGIVSERLIDKWLDDPQNAPGRLTSSPWPERIEVLEIKKTSQGTFLVKGEIIEVTSTEAGTENIASKKAVTLTVKKTDSGWIIDDVNLN